MGSFLTLMLGLAKQFIVDNASTIEAEVIHEIETIAADLFNTSSTVKNGTPPANPAKPTPKVS